MVLGLKQEETNVPPLAAKAISGKLQLKLPVPIPFLVKLYPFIIGLGIVSHTIPRSIIVVPPSSVIIPPDDAV